MLLSIQYFTTLQSYSHYINEEMREEAEANEITEAEYKSKIEEHYKYYDNVSRLREQIMGYFGSGEDAEMTPPEISGWNKDFCLHWIWGENPDSDSDSDSECECEGESDSDFECECDDCALIKEELFNKKKD